MHAGYKGLNMKNVNLKNVNVMTTNEEVTCMRTLHGFAWLSLDALCCLTFCTGCGGCCGRYEPFVAKVVTGMQTSPGSERSTAVCAVQCLAAIVLPLTFCGCLWGGCGLCTPCVNGIVKCVEDVETKPPIQIMVRPA